MLSLRTDKNPCSPLGSNRQLRRGLRKFATAHCRTHLLEKYRCQSAALEVVERRCGALCLTLTTGYEDVASCEVQQVARSIFYFFAT